jgi:acyl-CoA synthetase (AMP-forming)/AMP-acid ligase II
LIGTSRGASGSLRSVIVDHRHVAKSFANFYARFNYSDNARYLAVAPMAHSAGLLGCLHFARGGTNFIMATVDPGGILRAIQQRGITHLFAPPTLLHMMLIHPYVELFDYSSIQHFMIGAPVSVEELNHAIEIFGPVMAEIPFQGSPGQTQSVI